MGPTRPYLQAAALVSSTLLVGGFIGYRSGAFQLVATSEQPPTTPNNPQPLTAPAAEQPTPEKPPTFMSGSKSLNGIRGITFGLTPAGEAAPSDSVKQRTRTPEEIETIKAVKKLIEEAGGRPASDAAPSAVPSVTPSAPKP